jgi:hypothetical protein
MMRGTTRLWEGSDWRRVELRVDVVGPAVPAG